MTAYPMFDLMNKTFDLLSGSGERGCGVCHGSGWAIQFKLPCSHCGGTGKAQPALCAVCGQSPCACGTAHMGEVE